MKRKFIKKNKSRKIFRRTSGTHVKNLKPKAMRGGNRL
jgi:hypothetical protein